MPNRHQIRETASQLLYSLQIEGRISPESTEFDGFWDVLLDQEYLKLYSAQTRAVEHATRDRADKLNRFEERLDSILPELKGRDETGDLLRLLVSLGKLEKEWTTAQHNLFSTFKATTDNKTEELRFLLEEFFSLNSRLENLRAQCLTVSAGLPGLAPVIDPVMGAIRKLQATGQRVECIAHPLNFPDCSDTRHLRSSLKTLNILKEKTTLLVESILKEMESIDEALESSIDNYSPDRLSNIDRAILRLATYEILFTPETPLSVIISEAVETASCFSGTDAAKFINGVLNKIGTTYRPS